MEVKMEPRFAIQKLTSISKWRFQTDKYVHSLLQIQKPLLEERTRLGVLIRARTNL